MPLLPELIAYIIAIGLPIAYVFIVLTLDTFGTTNRTVLLICTLWGATGAFGFAYAVNTAVAQAIGFALVVAITAPILEEIVKSLILVYFIQRPSFRYFVDGAVYGFAVGIGFAAVENVSYISSTTAPPLTLAVSRVLSTALMHAVASAVVGLSLGALRRVQTSWRRYLYYSGIFLAIALHVVFNNVVGVLDGTWLLLVAIGIGIGGGVAIGYFINQALQAEKERFNESLGLDVDVSGGEVKAIQGLGGTAIESIFDNLERDFGDHQIDTIRRLLATQANIGILQNNLKSGRASPRLQKAWQEEIEELQGEVKKLRRELGPIVNNYMNSVFPPADDPQWQEEIGKYDPTLVHTFDTFMRTSELAGSFTPDQLEEMAERLSRADIFRNVSLANLENLSRAITIREFEDGQMIFDQGDAGDAMYVIEDGGVDIIIIEGDGSERVIKTLQPGSVLGEFAVLDGEERSARARASGPLKMLELSRQVFLMFIQSRPQVVLAVLQVLSGKARVTTRSVEDSVKYARQIAQGNYEELKAMAAATRLAPAVQPDAAPEEPSRAMLSEDGEPAVEEAPQVLRQAFAQVAVTLEEHEREMKEQLAGKSA